MQTETATLLAILAAPSAVVAVVLAMVIWLQARRGRRTLARVTTRLETAEHAVRDELAAGRASLAGATSTAADLRAQGARLDTDLAGWTDTLVVGRRTIERVTRGRLGPTVRAMQLAGALARLAMVWRTPAR